MVTFEGPQMQRQIGMNIARTLQSAALFVNALRHAYSTKTPMKADSADMVGTGELFSACERLQCELSSDTYSNTEGVDAAAPPHTPVNGVFFLFIF